MNMHLIVTSIFLILVVPITICYIKVDLIKKQTVNDKNGKSFLHLMIGKKIKI